MIQAVWRCMLGGNDHWVSYWSSDAKHSGLNDKQAALGRITKSGKDYRYRAGEPYDFTVAAVDAKRIGFGTWTRNGDDTNPLYAYACWDFEPLKQPTQRPTKKPSPDVALTSAGSRIAKNPTVQHRHRVYREAAACYHDAANLFLNDGRILAGYLVESSPNHYHVGILFSRHLSRQEHDAIVATIRASNRPFKNLDKDSSRARKGIGTQLRAPFCWKHGVQARGLKWFCKDEQQLIARGGTLRPPGLRHPRRKSAFDNPARDPTDRNTLLSWVIRQYPITPHTRDHLQFKLICNLLSRKIDADTIRHIGPLWLLHFNNQDRTPDPERQNFRTEQSEAEALFNSCLDSTLKNRDLQFKSKPTYNYQSLIDNYRVPPTQLATIQRILQSTRQRKRQTELSSPLQEGDDSSVCKKKNDNSQWASEVPLSQDAYFIEAIFVQLEINRLKDGLENRLRCTHQQLIEIIRRRHNTKICPRQFQRVKLRFCSLAREGRSYHHATKVELLVETQKGTPGLPSEYELADIVAPD